MAVPSPPIDKVLKPKPSLGGLGSMFSNIPGLASSSNATSGLNLSFGFNTAPVIGNSSNSPSQPVNWMVWGLGGLCAVLLYREFK